jgi:hypothetical protein
MLKTQLLIPPVVALAIAGIWLGSQRQSISTLERESAVLQKAIAARNSGSSPDSPRDKPASPAKVAKDKEPIDWKKVAAQFDEMRQVGGMADMRTMMRFQQRLQAMSKEELVAAFDEIAALDLPRQSREALEQMLLDPLARKDPEFALTKFVDRLQDPGGIFNWTLANAMQQWAKNDPSAAIAWFDRQIAAGKFESKSLDGRSQSRIQFEGLIINTLLGADPEAAGSRLASLPEDQRDDALSQLTQQLKEEDQLAFAKLVREQLSEKDQARTLARQASRLVGKDGYSSVTAYLDRIQATPAERVACVERAAESKIQSISFQKRVTREDLDAMREWVSAQAPERTGAVTGKALAVAARNGQTIEFSEAAALAVQYHDASGNDEVLSSFLNEWPTRQNEENKAQSRALAEKISDGKRREEILKKLK